MMKYELGSILQKIRQGGVECKTKHCQKIHNGKKYNCGSVHVCPYCSRFKIVSQLEDFMVAKSVEKKQVVTFFAEELCRGKDLKEKLKKFKHGTRTSKSTDAYRKMGHSESWSLHYIIFEGKWAWMSSIISLIGVKNEFDGFGDFERTKNSRVLDACNVIAPRYLYDPSREYKSIWDKLQEGYDENLFRCFYEATLGTKASTWIRKEN